MRRLAIAVLWFSAAAYAQIGLWTAHPAKGAPFSADVVSQSSRVSSDGNRIHRTGNGKLFRDSEGRTRSELTETRTGQPVQVVLITDPVAQISIHYTIASQGPHFARVHHLVPHSSGTVVSTPRERLYRKQRRHRATGESGSALTIRRS